MENEKSITKVFSTHEIHEMLNERAGKEISEYDMRTLMDCWRLHRRIFDNAEQTGFTKSEAEDFLNYAY